VYSNKFRYYLLSGSTAISALFLNSIPHRLKLRIFNGDDKKKKRAKGTLKMKRIALKEQKIAKKRFDEMIAKMDQPKKDSL